MSTLKKLDGKPSFQNKTEEKWNEEKEAKIIPKTERKIKEIKSRANTKLKIYQGSEAI